MTAKPDLDDYKTVPERIAEFRAKYPDGRLRPADPARPFLFETLADGQTVVIVVAAAYRSETDTLPGIGMASEPYPGRTPYTRNSELMNAETSAWGRAIVATLAADTTKSVASHEEIRNRRDEEDRAAGAAFEGATPARPRQNDGNRQQQRGQVSRPQQPAKPAEVTDEIDIDAQAFADEAHGALSLNEMEDITRRSREAGKLTALVRNPSSDGTGKPGKLAVYLDWKRKQIRELDQALTDLTTAASETGFPVTEIETHVKAVTGTDLEVASVAQIRHATQALRTMQGAAA